MTDYISTSQLKSYMGIADSDDDAGLANAISASSQAINSWCERDFTVASSTASNRVYHVDDVWNFYVDDFTTTSTLVVTTDSGDNGTYDTVWTATRDYIVYPLNGIVDGISGWPFNHIAATGFRYFPISGLGSGLRPRLQVTAQWGWAAVPDPVIQACYMKAARIFRRWQSPEGAGGFTAPGFAVPLIKSSIREDPDVMALLAPYRKLGAIMR